MSAARTLIFCGGLLERFGITLLCRKGSIMAIGMNQHEIASQALSYLMTIKVFDKKTRTVIAYAIAQAIEKNNEELASRLAQAGVSV